MEEAAWLEADTSVTRDLEKYGVDVDFIAGVSREACTELAYGPPTWDNLVGLAQREAARLGVPRPAWQEAVRLMGRRGAAAAMIAIVHKAGAGLVERPGAYLRGMSAKAATGELQLGRTFHGFKAPKADAPGRANRNARDLVRQTAARWRTGPAQR